MGVKLNSLHHEHNEAAERLQRLINARETFTEALEEEREHIVELTVRYPKGGGYQPITRGAQAKKVLTDVVVREMESMLKLALEDTEREIATQKLVVARTTRQYLREIKT